MKIDDRHAVYELARFMTELSVIDYFFVIHRPSVIAFASVLNAMEEIPAASQGIPSFASEIQKNTPLDANAQEVRECRKRLRLLYAQGGYSRPLADTADQRDESISPVSVAYGYQPMYGQYDPYAKGY